MTIASAEEPAIANDIDAMDTSTKAQIPTPTVDETSIAHDLDAMIQSQIADEMSQETAEHAATDPSPLGTSTKDIEDLDDMEGYKGPEDLHNGHAEQCCGSPGASTPPTSPRPSNTRASDNRDSATTVTTIPVEIRQQEALHKKALALKPTMPADRYCIGILNPRKLPKDIRKEDDFLWMKGHKVCMIYLLHTASHRTGRWTTDTGTQHRGSELVAD